MRKDLKDENGNVKWEALNADLATRLNRKNKASRGYELCEARLKLQRKKKYGDEDLAIITELMAAAGFILKIENDELIIRIDENKLSKVRHSTAGRGRTMTEYKYSNIILLMQIMTDKEIAEQVGMPMATYYRHKKAMKDSLYYRSLDKEKLGDVEYLQSVNGNTYF